jgi:DNA polymerase II large subunit
MATKDYLDGFAVAKKAALASATKEIKAAERELTYKLSPTVKDKTLVRLQYARKIAQNIRKIVP